MQNMSEQQTTSHRISDADNSNNGTPAPSRGSFALFMVAGFIAMTAIVFTGLYIDQITPVLLPEAAPPPQTQAAAVTPVALDSLAAMLKIADDTALEIRDGLTLWLKADALADSNNNKPAAIFPDASGKQLHAKQPTPAGQPLYIANAINGKPALRFDGIDDYYFLGTVGDSTPATIFSVWAKPNEGGGAYQRVYSSSGTNIDYTSSGAAFIPPTANNGIAASGPQIQMDIAPIMDLRNFYIGRLNANAEQFYFGDLAELIIYKRQLTATEQQSVKTYLQKKYSL